jgi:hypothetical protein
LLFHFGKAAFFKVCEQLYCSVHIKVSSSKNTQFNGWHKRYFMCAADPLASVVDMSNSVPSGAKVCEYLRCVYVHASCLNAPVLQPYKLNS